MAKFKRPHKRKERGLGITRLMARDGQTCGICGKPLNRKLADFESPEYVTFDHIVPVSSGGTDELNNLRLAHLSCNKRRGGGLKPLWPWETE